MKAFTFLTTLWLIILPLLDLFIRDKLSMRLSGSSREQRQVDRSDSALVWRLGGFGTSHVSSHPARAAGVQQNLQHKESPMNAGRQETK